MNYIATWFYKESKDEASFYPQGGGKGDSPLLHSIYMQIQVPFFVTFRHFNPDAHLLFFTNLEVSMLPPFLQEAFRRLKVKVITRPYQNRPPKGWYSAWQNQFYIYDIFQEMESRMKTDDCLLVCDADCICIKPLTELFQTTRSMGSALYELQYAPTQVINGTTLKKMEAFYTSCYGKQPSSPIRYYGGEFIALRKDNIQALNQALPSLWEYNLKQTGVENLRLCEEAHVLSLLAERLSFRNSHANRYVKRMWTNPHFRNITSGDEELPVWHLPYEKKRGLYYLYRYFTKLTYTLGDEAEFLRRAQYYNGIPHRSFRKRLKDRITVTIRKLFALC